MCICTCAHLHTCVIRISRDGYGFASVYAVGKDSVTLYVCMYVCVCVYMHVCICMCACVYVEVDIDADVFDQLHILIDMRMHIRKGLHTHMHIHIHMHRYTHINMHIHVHVRIQQPSKRTYLYSHGAYSHMFKISNFHSSTGCTVYMCDIRTNITHTTCL
jgi:hypothetical protein